MSETLVSDLRKKFSEQQVIGPKPLTTPKPLTSTPKPLTTPKPKPFGNGTRNNNVDSQPVNSLSNLPRPAKPTKPSIIARPKDLGTPGKFGTQPNISEGIKAVHLRRAPPPKAPIHRTTTPSEDTELSRVLHKRNSKKVFPGGDKENKDETISSVKIRSDSSSSTNSIGSNASSIVLALGGKPQRVELPSVRDCGHRPPKKAKPPIVRLPKATPPKPKPPVVRPPATKRKPERQVSLIQPTSDSEEEDQPLYDDTETSATPVPRLKKIIEGDEESAPLSHMPNYQSTPQVTTFSDDFGDTYDMVGDTGEDIYEAVDADEIMEGRMPPGENNVENQEDERATEKQRKELEKQKKKEEEKREKERLKKERDEKKKKEKEEKENRKKFNIKGDITVLREMVSTEAYTAVDKLDIGCYSGEPLDLIRTDNNPEDRWLVRNKQGVYGYVKIYCVDDAEAQEFYDDVEVHIEEEFEDEEVYDTCS